MPQLRPTRFRLTLAAGVAGLFVATAAAQDYVPRGNETAVELGQVPDPVKKAAAKAVPGVDFTRAFRDSDKFLRLVGREPEQGGRVVIVQVLEPEEVLTVTKSSAATPKQVPRAVQKALDKARKSERPLEGFRADRVEKAEVRDARKNETRNVYRYEGVGADGTRVEAVVRDDGTFETARFLLPPDTPRKDEDGIPVSQLPQAVARGLRENVPGVRFSRAVPQSTKPEESGYLVRGKDNRGRAVEADVAPDGNVVSVRHEMGLREVPEDYRGAFQQALGDHANLEGFRAQKAFRLELRQFPPNGALVYGFVGRTMKGEVQEVRVGPEEGQVTVTAAAPGALDDAPKDAAADKADASASKPGGKSAAKKKRGRR